MTVAPPMPMFLLVPPTTLAVTIVTGMIVTAVLRGIVVVATSAALAATFWGRRSLPITTSVGMVLWTVVISVVVLTLISTEIIKET